MTNIIDRIANESNEFTEMKNKKLNGAFITAAGDRIDIKTIAMRWRSR